jgi:hypothetical protein
VAVAVVLFFVAVGKAPSCEYAVVVVVFQQAVKVIFDPGVNAVPPAYDVVPFHHLLNA